MDGSSGEKMEIERATRLENMQESQMDFLRENRLEKRMYGSVSWFEPRARRWGSSLGGPKDSKWESSLGKERESSLGNKRESSRVSWSNRKRNMSKWEPKFCTRLKKIRKGP